MLHWNWPCPLLPGPVSEPSGSLLRHMWDLPMAGQYNDTEMGGAGGSFLTTRWSQIINLKVSDRDQQTVPIDSLIRAYWRPVYCYLRRKGYASEEAKDLTQGFFHEIVLGRELIQQADQAKGRFRTFLLTALDRYVTSVYRKETADKRVPAGELVRMEVPQLTNMPVLSRQMTPEQVFHYAWAVDLLDQILDTVKRECIEVGKEVHWRIFHERLVAPTLTNTKPPSLSSLCAGHGVEDEAKASNMIITVKRRFVAVMKRYLRQSTQTDSEADDEFGQLLEILSKGGAG